MLVVLELAKESPLRFSELKRRIKGISQRMLTVTFRDLERNGVLTRTMYPSIPPKVEYALTCRCFSPRTYPQLGELGGDRRSEITTARKQFDAQGDKFL